VTAKFLVVATIGLLAALVNVLSVGATMHFGGLTKVFASGEMPVKFPASTLPIIVFSMIPFAMLSSAILVAVCSFARSYKEAQTYVTPVIILALVPAIAATLPSIQLKGSCWSSPWETWCCSLASCSSRLHPVPGVDRPALDHAVCGGGGRRSARLFGQEAVLFADAGSYRTLVQRRLMPPSPAPSVTQAVVLVALLFRPHSISAPCLPTFLIGNLVRGLSWLAVIQFGGLFLLLPLAVAIFFKIDLVSTFRLRLPPLRSWPAAVLIGASSWIIASEFFALQARIVPPSEAIQELNRVLSAGAEKAPLWTIVLLLAVVPAISEEFLFRGFLLSGLGRSVGKWTAIIGAGLVFGVFHFVADKIPVTALMGVLLGYICWKSRSLWPGILAHILHNSALMLLPSLPRVVEWLGLSSVTRVVEWLGLISLESDPEQFVPIRLVALAAAMLLTGLVILASLNDRDSRAAGRLPG